MKKLVLLALVVLCFASCKKYNCKYYYDDIKKYYDVSTDTWTDKLIEGAIDDTDYHRQMYKIEYEMRTLNQQYKYCVKYPITVTTGEIAPKSGGVVVCHGTATSEVANSVLSYGFCWADLSNPVVITDDFEEVGSGEGDFTATISGFTPLHTYYIRAYAVTADGVTYGEAVNFTAY